MIQTRDKEIINITRILERRGFKLFGDYGNTVWFKKYNFKYWVRLSTKKGFTEYQLFSRDDSDPRRACGQIEYDCPDLEGMLKLIDRIELRTKGQNFESCVSNG